MNRSEMMAAVRSKNTRPEMLVRRMAHVMGYRYRLHVSTLPGKPDLVFPARRSVIFVHGCFWHQHGCSSGDSHLPNSNKSYWHPKLERNRARDAEHLKALGASGWKCLVLWECELAKPKTIQHRLASFLGPSTSFLRLSKSRPARQTPAARTSRPARKRGSSPQKR